jgi:Anti-sigma factor NepR
MVDKKKIGKAKKLKEKSDKMNQSLTRPEVSELIGQRLRKFYEGTSQQPVPDRFIELLKQLEDATSPKKES